MDIRRRARTAITLAATVAAFAAVTWLPASAGARPAAQACDPYTQNCNTSTSTTSPTGSSSTTSTTNPGNGGGGGNNGNGGGNGGGNGSNGGGNGSGNNGNGNGNNGTPPGCAQPGAANNPNCHSYHGQPTLTLSALRVGQTGEADICAPDPTYNGTTLTITRDDTSTPLATGTLSVNPPKASCASAFSLGHRTAAGPGLLALVSPFARVSQVAQAANVAYTRLRFTVPAMTPGNHEICAVASGMEAACQTVNVLPGGVQGVSQSNGSAAGASSTSGSSGSSLAFTGLKVGLLLVIAGGLVVIGRGLVLGSRARRA